MKSIITNTPHSIEIANSENLLEIVEYSDELGVYTENDTDFGRTIGVEVQFDREDLLDFLLQVVDKYGNKER